ncbi:IclR family transcriptional regulator [Brucella intermedia]|uniref:IclR family transcriptional regulator n=1 Tax=Brucella intermedia TaxID=94625 RepID=UPI00224A8CAA|nr:IclR family transcriptional regulator C-terminal domain-containing protein [Brucella intermedia]
MTLERARGTDRLLDILEKLFETETPYSRNSLASAMGVPRSTVYTLVDQLISRGWLEQSPSGTINLGHKSGLLGLAYRSHTHFEQTANEVLLGLVEETGQAAELNVVDNWQQLVVLAVKGPEHSYLQPVIGRRFHLPSTVSARVLLDSVSPDRLQANIPSSHFSAESETPNLETLVRQIEEARQAGFAIGHGLIDRHISVMAVPVHDGNGDCIAAISLIMLSEEIATKVDQVRPAMIQAAQRLTSTLRVVPWPMGRHNLTRLRYETDLIPSK